MRSTSKKVTDEFLKSGRSYSGRSRMELAKNVRIKGGEVNEIYDLLGKAENEKRLFSRPDLSKPGYTIFETLLAVVKRLELSKYTSKRKLAAHFAKEAVNA